MTSTPRRLLRVPAPAKLNLFLHVNGQRPDGYHLLQSVFVLLDWCDHLDFEVRSDTAVLRQDANPHLGLPAEDLCVKAARALQQVSGCRLGANITLHKQLPAEAGLGGGSSDAASTLLALNHLWGLHLPRTTLAEIGLQLGADVPFFVHGHSAWVEGVGERITALPLQDADCVVLKPPTGASTRAIFTASDLCRSTPHMPAPSPGTDPIHPAAFLQGTHNDLQPVAQRLCPQITEALAWLDAQGLQGRMSGSGSAVFALLPNRCVLETAPAGWTLKKCGILARHPIFDGSFGLE